MFLLISTFFLLASAIIANKFALSVLSPMALVAIRMLGGGLVLLWQERSSLKAIKNFIFPLTLIALCTTFINSLLKAYALQHLPSSKAALIAGLDPIITAMIAFVMFRESLNAQQLLAIGLAMIGSASLCYDGISGWSTIAPIASCAAFAAIVIGRYGWIKAQKILVDAHLTPRQLNAGMMVISGSIALAWLMASPTDFFSQLSNLNSVNLIFALLYTTVIGNVLAYPLYASLLKKYSATLLSLFGFLIPLFVTLLAIPLLSETCTSRVIISGAIMFAGVALFIKASK
ncbi:EamA family transporter [Candidatus Dependentiae bacterium]|nr:EamA family transporter [Candidatus Dependentiae bacterium]